MIALLVFAALAGGAGGGRHRGPGRRDLRPDDPGRGQRLPARRRPGGRGGGRPALPRPRPRRAGCSRARSSRSSARARPSGIPINGKPLGRYEDSPRLRPDRPRAPAVLGGRLRRRPTARPRREPEDGVRITKGRIRVAVAPATDLTKANADLRRVPFMLAHALEQTKRFQVADPTVVQEHLLSQKTRERGAAGESRQGQGAPARPWRSRAGWSRC